MPEFVHLHNHTHYSLLDGACTPEQLIKAAVEDGQKAIALTDHGVMFGTMEFYKKAKKAGIKPIIGCEAYVANGSRFDKDLGKGTQRRKNYYHLVLLAKNDIGYRNLIKLTSYGHTEGFYYKPRIDTDILSEYSEGLIALSACAGGVVNAHILNGDMETARKSAIFYKELFDDDFYLELQDHKLAVDGPILEHIPKLARDLNIKMVATNDCHYIRQEHAVAHNVLLHIKDVTSSTAGTVDVSKLRYGAPEMYFKSAEEMAQIFGKYEGALDHSLEIAEKCDFKFDNKLHMPEFPIPPESPSTTLDEYLEELTMLGLDRRYKQLNKDITDRAEFELNVIKTMGFPGYFLIVQDFIAAARNMGVSVGPGRGSAAGSLVAYALGITNVDPLQYNLLFERFLNPDRVSMPDIDIDFNDEKREKVIQYVRDKYGANSVAQIITFGTLSSRAVLKDVGRVLGVPLSTIESITKNIPVILGKVTPIKEALDLPELRWVKESDDPKLRQLIEYAQVLEGFCRNASLHAAGVVIAPGDIANYVPLYKTPNSELATQYNMKDLEDAGLLKMDFLGLRTLSIIDNTLAMIEHNHGLQIDIDKIDFFDKPTYALLGEGKTLAVFQFESEPMQKALKQLKPTNLEDLTAMNALYRPGPMGNIPDFIDRKHGRKPIEYLHPLMEPALNNTYGIIVYQEQVMQLVRDIGGFTLAQSDIMRRAMGKKDEKLMQEQRAMFIDGAKKNGFNEKLSGEIFDLILKFAAYGFNKSHSLAYSYLAFQTAWLKKHYTAEFLAANMTAELNDLDKIVLLIDEAKSFGIEVLPPDVNESHAMFTAVDSSTIRFGLAAIKNVGVNVVECIMRAREEKPFVSLFDFTSRVEPKALNRRSVEALVCAGAFDSMKSGHRAQLFEAIESALKYAQACTQSRNPDMDSLFGGETGVDVISEPALPEAPQWNFFERLKKEKEYLNFYISGHPLERYRAHVSTFSTLTLSEKEHPLIGKTTQVRVCGIVSAIRTKLDKRENTIGFVTLEDFTGRAECIFWSDAFARFRDFLVTDAMVLVVGRAELNGSSSLKIIADDVIPLEETPKRFATGFHIALQRGKTTPEEIVMARKRLASMETGNGPLVFSIYDDSPSPVKRYRTSGFKIKPTHEAAVELMNIFGSRNVKFLTD